VLNKIRIILFPVTLKTEDWKRKNAGYDFNNEELTPKGDLQAPDLYIPLMSFVTFILLTGLYLANTLAGFDPAVLGYIFTKSMFIWLFETTIMKGLFTIFNIGHPPFFELLAYTGYKFVVLCIIVFA